MRCQFAPPGAALRSSRSVAIEKSWRIFVHFVTGSLMHPATTSDVITWTQGFDFLILDLGTGDGRFVRDWARTFPQMAIIGVDLCAANVRNVSRGAGGNARFLIADACALSEEIFARADLVNIAFPWGLLLRHILAGNNSLVTRIVAASKPGAMLKIVINADSARSCGLGMSQAQNRILNALSVSGAANPLVTSLERDDLKALPSTWAKRLAFGRNPHAVAISTCVSSGSMPTHGDPTRVGTLYHQSRSSHAASRG